MISVHDAISLVTFTRDEERSLAKLEAAVDVALHEKFDGSPPRLEFKQAISPKIAHALQRKYECGGWRVTVILKPDTSIFNFVPMFFAPGIAKKTEVKEEPKKEKEETLPPVTTLQAPYYGKRLLVRMPTRGRPNQALSVLAAYRRMAGSPITLEVVIDEDDVTMTVADVMQRLSALGCVITVGKHENKIAAVNGGRVKDWDILLLASDDMMPVAQGYGVRVISAMEEHFPHLDGVIYFDDGAQGKNLVTLPIFGRRLYDQFNYVYNSEYTSLFSDTEQTELLNLMGRIHYVDEKIIEHRHHVWGLSKNDALYQRNDKYWDQDKAVYEKRKATKRSGAQWGFDSPVMWWSVLICSMPSRRAQLDRLIDHLYAQISEYPREIEIIVDDREGITIGEKRQALLEKSKAHYISFIDDDDLVSANYVKRNLTLLRDVPDTDCVSLIGMMTTAGAVPERFEHSIKNQEWSSKDGVHLRSPNHLNVVRRDLALQAGFVSKNHGEDYLYSQALRPLLKKEASIGSTPEYFYFYWPGKTTGKP